MDIWKNDQSYSMAKLLMSDGRQAHEIDNIDTCSVIHRKARSVAKVPATMRIALHNLVMQDDNPRSQPKHE